MGQDPNIGSRKIEHIDVVINKPIKYPGLCEELYNSIILIHQAFPGLDYRETDLTTKFLGYRLNAPIMITGMTGGHPYTRDINAKLAELASSFKIALGVGSQRSMLVTRNKEIIETYKVVRKIGDNIPVVGNIGINTLNDLKYSDVEYLVEQLEADALAIHLNPGQELIQPEGDTRFNSKVLRKVEEIIDQLDVPVIIKEVGTGLSLETVKIFYSIGIRYFDVAGACGTNWMLVEMYRDRTTELKRDIASLLKNWGIPTPVSLIEARYVAPNAVIIASGGVWDGLRAVKNLVLGADLVGLALPILRHILEKPSKAYEYLQKYIETMKSVMFLIGARNLDDLRKKPIVILEPLRAYVEQRGINIKTYVEHIRKGGKLK